MCYCVFAQKMLNTNGFYDIIAIYYFGKGLDNL